MTCPVCRGTGQVPERANISFTTGKDSGSWSKPLAKGYNVKENEDGTISPLDPTKPSGFTTDYIPMEPQDNDTPDLDELHSEVASWLNDNFADLQPWEVDDEPLEGKYWGDFDRRILPIIKKMRDKQ